MIKSIEILIFSEIFFVFIILPICAKNKSPIDKGTTYNIIGGNTLLVYYNFGIQKNESKG